MTKTLAAFHSFRLTYKINDQYHRHLPRPFYSSVQFQTNGTAGRCSGYLRVTRTRVTRLQKIRSVAEETQIPENLDEIQEKTSSDQAVSVPVSSSDKLMMYFQAEGTINETAIPTVTKALEETEGISDLKVEVSEGIASVELTKQTTIQATGVASGLVEIIQGSGFKLQTLNLSFADEDEILA
ncbi:hypothetical protein Nepgr_013395 [Nepenthes gracilis]|uniref:HMA domain-containing protein n=1 Tax=Nepenthes gracilis TaxID=150966 RepID=A0AAD3SJ48_NEPGR|nr:hypothetical protein Nepgr_013395 [Nepenthes gracilis]